MDVMEILFLDYDVRLWDGWRFLNQYSFDNLLGYSLLCMKCLFSFSKSETVASIALFKSKEMSLFFQKMGLYHQYNIHSKANFCKRIQCF